MTEAGAAPIPGAPPGIPFLRLPRAAEVFARRAARFAALAEDHAAGDWLLALSQLCAAQRGAAEAEASFSGRDGAGLEQLRVVGGRRGEGWRRALAFILRALRETPLPPPAREAASRLEGASAQELEALADGLLGTGEARPDAAASPLLAAALQVAWTSLAERLPAGLPERATHRCPLCGAPPVAGVVLGDDKLRYLACSLCATEWHLVRLQCATCRSAAQVSYYSIEGAGGGLKAEACDGCRTYLKLFYLEASPAAEPLADDAATLALDLLLAERGYSRGGVNLLVAPIGGS